MLWNKAQMLDSKDIIFRKEYIKIFHHFGFHRVSQKGSHVKLRRVKNGSKQTLTIPVHKEIDRGTLRAIYSQAQRYLPEEDLRGHFLNVPRAQSYGCKV
jgi:predicted RNA binding protein YcfA (HicA-like mRNA interferase family)